MADAKLRVKVYFVNDEGDWAASGCGHVSCVKSEPKKLDLVVRSEEDESTILKSNVQMDDVYKLQQGSLIVWTEPDGTDSALSFQQQDGCMEVWKTIRTHQNRSVDIPTDFPESNENGENQAENNENDPSLDVHIEDEVEMDIVEMEMEISSLFNLPECTMENLSEMASIFSKPSLQFSPKLKEKISEQVNNKQFIPKLFDFFHQCEDLDDEAGLKDLFRIFKGIVLLNDTVIFEVLFSKDNIMDLIGVFEHDPDTPHKQNHREFLSEKAVFKEVIPMSTVPGVEDIIFVTFRLQYLKDVVLPCMLDDSTFSTINSLIFFNHIEIVGMLHQDENFLPAVFALIEAPESQTNGKMKDLMAFMVELCTLAKNLQIKMREGFYETSIKHGLFRIFPICIKNENVSVRMGILEVFSLILNHDPSIIRRHIMLESEESVQSEDACLLLLVRCLVNDRDAGIKTQVTEVLNQLLEVESMNVTESADFLNYFYGTSFKELVSPLVKLGQAHESSTPPTSTSSSSSTTATTSTSTASPSAASTSTPSSISPPIITTTTPTTTTTTPSPSSSSSSYPSSSASPSASLHMAPITPTSLSPLSTTTTTTTTTSKSLLRINKPKHFDEIDLLAFYNIIDMLTSFVNQHNHHIRRQLLTGTLIQDVVSILNWNQVYLSLAALRFLRSIIKLKDEFINRFIFKHKLLDPVVEVFKRNGNKYNMLNSAILELFDYIGKENIASLKAYIAKNYSSEFADIEYVQTFKYLFKEGPSAETISDDPHNEEFDRFRRDARNLDVDEESWFEQEDDDGSKNADINTNSSGTSNDDVYGPSPKPSTNDTITKNSTANTGASTACLNVSSSSGLSDAKIDELIHKRALVDYDDSDEDDDEDDFVSKLTSGSNNGNSKNALKGRSSPFIIINANKNGSGSDSENDQSDKDKPSTDKKDKDYLVGENKRAKFQIKM